MELLELYEGDLEGFGGLDEFIVARGTKLTTTTHEENSEDEFSESDD